MLIGGTVCTNVFVVNSTYLTCNLGPGVGTNLLVEVGVYGRFNLASNQSRFSYILNCTNAITLISSTCSGYPVQQYINLTATGIKLIDLE